MKRETWRFLTFSAAVAVATSSTQVPARTPDRSPSVDSIFDLNFSLDDSKVLLASADEFTYIRPVDRFDNPIACLGHHQGTVKSAKWSPSDPHLMITAARDGDVAIWDLRIVSANPQMSTPVNVLSNVHRKSFGTKKNPERSSVVQAQFLTGQSHLVASIGQPDHAIRIWDTRYKWGPAATPLPFASIDTPTAGGRERAFTTFTMDSTGSRLYAANANNRLYAYCMSNFSSTPAQVYEAPGFESGSFFVKLAVSPDDQYLASGHIMEHTYVWSVDGASCHKLGGHYKEVTAVSWTTGACGDLMLTSAGEDGSINVWSESPQASLVGFGLPQDISQCSRRPPSDPVAALEEERTLSGEYLRDLPSRLDMMDIENFRPSTPVELMAPPISSCRSTGRKSVISDYFRPLVQSGITEHLLSTHRTSPLAPVLLQPTPSAKKRSFLSFCTPSRTVSKLVKMDPNNVDTL